MVTERDLDVARRSGFYAFTIGTPRDACPHSDDEPELRDAWLGSWDNGQNQPKPQFA